MQWPALYCGSSTVYRTPLFHYRSTVAVSSAVTPTYSVTRYGSPGIFLPTLSELLVFQSPAHPLLSLHQVVAELPAVHQCVFWYVIKFLREVIASAKNPQLSRDVLGALL
jgi:hypothetical protein